MKTTKTLALAGFAVALFGCSGGGKSITGTWVSVSAGPKVTLTAKDDGSFVIAGGTNTSGAWKISGNDVSIYPDLRKTPGYDEFGGSSDGAVHYTLSSDGKTLTGPKASGTVFKKQQG